MEFESTNKPKMKFIIKRKKRRQQTQIKRENVQKNVVRPEKIK